MSKKQKILVTILCSIAGLLLVIGGGMTFAINYNVASTPTVEIVDDGDNLYLKTQAIDGYRGYRFRFVTGSDVFYIDSDTNIIELTNNQKIVPGMRYSVSVCYLGEIEGNNTNYSASIDWTAYIHLQAPEIVYDIENDKITWDEVDGATYYLVYYGQIDEFLQVEECEISLQLLTGGGKNIYVVAYSNVSYLTQSKNSNILKVEVVHHLLPFTSIDFDSYQLQLTLVGKEELSSIDVFINDTCYTVVKFNVQKNVSGNYVYSIALNAVYREGATIGACPSTINGYNVYLGEILYYQEDING